MIKKLCSSKLFSAVVFSTLAFLAGGLNGFVGTGGGILLVFALCGVLGVDKKDSFATSLCITVPVSLVALFNYFKTDSIDFSLASEICLPTLLGGFVGAVLVDKLKLPWLNGIFGILIIYSGMCLILR